MLSRVEQLEVFQSDLETLIEKKKQYEMDVARNVSLQSVSSGEHFAFEPNLYLLNISIEESQCMLSIFQNENIYTDVLMIISNFVEENSSKLSNEHYLNSFENIIVHCYFNGTISLPFSSSYTERTVWHQFEMLLDLISDYIDGDRKILALVCHDLIISEMIDRGSKSWLNRYPQYSEITSMDDALELYAEVKEEQVSHADRLQLACWFALNVEQRVDANTLFYCVKTIEQELPDFRKAKEKSQFKRKMLTSKESFQPIHSEDITSSSNSITIETVDLFSGIEFEQFVGSIFEADGYQVDYTQATNDKGIDIIAKRGLISVGIQCKCYSSPVGVSAVQEVFAGRSFYSLQKAMVITNNVFTKAAIDLAKSTDVILWDRTILETKIKMMF